MENQHHPCSPHQGYKSATFWSSLLKGRGSGLYLHYFVNFSTKFESQLQLLLRSSLHLFRRDFRAEISPKYFRGQKLRLYLHCISTNDKNCQIEASSFNNITPPNVSNLFTYSSKIHHHKTPFSMARNFYIQYLRTDDLKNSFSSIGALRLQAMKAWNSQEIHVNFQLPCQISHRYS